MMYSAPIYPLRGKSINVGLIHMGKLVNIIAFLLPIGLFIYFGLIGTATLSLLRTQRNTLQNLLLSPAIGVAFTLLPVFLLSRAGLPVKLFAIPLTLLLLLLSGAVIVYRKPIIPMSRYIGFALVFFLSLFLTGRPLLHFGFNWLSYANDDMANYCLGALRFLNHGYSDVPNLTEMVQGKDYSQFYWFSFIPAMMRSGSELFLAWLSGLTHQNPLQIFMILIVGLHLILISSMAAMVLVSKKRRTIALITSLFLACSALTTLGTLYQLIAQVLGLSLLIALGTLLQQVFTTTKNYQLFRYSILLSVIASTLLISYPEIVAILVFAWIVYFIISLANGWRPTRSFTLLISMSLMESIVLLNTYWINVVSFVHFQATADLTHSKGDLFPYFLVPSGVADLWGLAPLAMIPGEPLGSITIFLGFFLSMVTIFLLIKQTANRYFPAIVALVIMLFAIHFYMGTRQQSGFMLFKLAMYVQPFICAILAEGIYQQISSKKRRFISIMFLAGLGIGVQFSYLLASYGGLGQPYSELPLASNTNFSSELSMLTKKIPKNLPIISEATSVVSVKLQSLFLAEKNTQYYSNVFFYGFSGGEIFKYTLPKLYNLADGLKLKLLSNELKLPFVVKNNNQKRMISYFSKSGFSQSNDALLLMEGPLRSIFNRYQMMEADNTNYLTIPISNISNHLVFVSSSLGQNYYLGESQHISLYGLEKDYFNPQSSMASIGRYLLFQIINPSSHYRLVLDFTESMTHKDENKLHEATIIGDKEYPLPLIGRGSARVFSTVFTPQMIKGDPYFMVDMGVNPTAAPRIRKGLNRLYGNDIPLNYRLFVGHARDISLISDSEYEQLTPPSSIQHFPEDLKNANLEYSGIYEDGWLSEDVALRLTQLQPKTKLTIQGSLPTFREKSTPIFMTVYIDNEKISEKQINSGPFQFQLDAPNGNIKRNVKLHFSDQFSLPKGDDRLVAVKIDIIGFKQKESGRHYLLPSYIDDFASALRNKKFEYSGIYEDGWCSKDAYLKLSQPKGHSKLIIDGLLPYLRKQKGSMLLEVYIDNQKINQSRIKPGLFKFAMNVSEGNVSRKIQLKFSNSSFPSRRDHRLVSVRINQIGFQSNDK